MDRVLLVLVMYTYVAEKEPPSQVNFCSSSTQHSLKPIHTYLAVHVDVQGEYLPPQAHPASSAT